MASEESLQRVAQVWCEPKHSMKTMDPDLAESFATILDEQLGKPNFVFVEETTIEPCDACCYRTKCKKFRKEMTGGLPDDDPNVWRTLCEICSHTMIGTVYSNHKMYPSQINILTTIGYIGNLLLDEIKKARHDH